MHDRLESSFRPILHGSDEDAIGCSVSLMSLEGLYVSALLGAIDYA